MVEATYHFPRGFLWGTATSSHQVEGYNKNNNWWGWEQESGRILEDHKSGAACDWWGGRWRDDFDRAAESGQNAHRLSIEWSRIQPTPDLWEESSLDRYREIVRGLVERGMTPMVTLHHFSDPLWLSEIGGWEDEKAVFYFTPYVKKVVDALKEYVNHWITINEPNVLATSAYLLGDFPPGKQDSDATFKAMGNLARAHAEAYHAIHEIQSTARVGMAVNYRGFIPAKSWSPFDKWIARTFSSMFNNFFPTAAQTGILRYPLRRERLETASGTQDFLGINYYTDELVAFNLLMRNELFARRFYADDAELSETGFIANTPTGFFQALKWGRQFDVPIIVTENGIEDSEDQVRPRYLIQHLHQLWRATNFNFRIKGYFHWTLVDNFEWERGWTQRFGLWELDVENQTRTKRPSADLYAEICKANGISHKTVDQYAPEIFDSLFPT